VKKQSTKLSASSSVKTNWKFELLFGNFAGKNIQLFFILEKGVKMPKGVDEKKSISLRLLGEANKKKDFKFP